jgi:hypothetical protein
VFHVLYLLLFFVCTNKIIIKILSLELILKKQFELFSARCLKVCVRHALSCKQWVVSRKWWRKKMFVSMNLQNFCHWMIMKENFMLPAVIQKDNWKRTKMLIFLACLIFCFVYSIINSALKYMFIKIFYILNQRGNWNSIKNVIFTSLFHKYKKWYC